MHDLRKKALLESGKTMSRKARSRPDSKTATPSASPGHSPSVSRNASRNVSRNVSVAGSPSGSDDEDAYGSDFDDLMTASTHSASEIPDDIADTGGDLADKLHERISQITTDGRGEEGKKLGTQEREAMLRSYLYIMRHKYAQPEIWSTMGPLVRNLVKAARNGVTSAEKLLALEALAVTIITNPTDDVLDQHSSSLKATLEDEEGGEDVKAAAIQALAVATMFGDGSVDAAEDMLEYLMDIVQGDGHTVGAPDSGPVVVAALQSWGFIAALLEEPSDLDQQAMEAFVEQLDSTDVYVQVAAGNNIALIFEKAREADEESGEKTNFQYDPKILARQMRDISHGSKSLSRKDKLHLKTSFTSIATGLERGKGPMYSTAWRMPDKKGPKPKNSSQGDDDPAEYGYRQTVSVGGSKVTVETWATAIKLQFLKTLLVGGLAKHLRENDTVRDII